MYCIVLAGSFYKYDTKSLILLNKINILKKKDELVSGDIGGKFQDFQVKTMLLTFDIDFLLQCQSI